APCGAPAPWRAGCAGCTPCSGTGATSRPHAAWPRHSRLSTCSPPPTISNRSSGCCRCSRPEEDAHDIRETTPRASKGGSMIPAPFDYHSPKTLSEAIGLLAQYDDAKVLSGGQSLLPLLKLRLGSAGHPVDLGRTPGLEGIRHA